MADTALFRVRVAKDLKARLDRLATATSRSISALTEEALAAYVDEHEPQIARIREGLADAAAGRAVPHEDVVGWLDSWGAEPELPAASGPTCFDEWDSEADRQGYSSL